MREKNEHSAQSKHLLNLTKEGFQNQNTSSQSHVGEHGLLRAKWFTPLYTCMNEDKKNQLCSEQSKPFHHGHAHVSFWFYF